jgi:hypothetical protein
MRVISDEEFIRLALSSEITKIKYQGEQDAVANYQHNHPGCCRVFRNAPYAYTQSFSVFSKRISVDINYELKQPAFSESIPSPYKYYRGFVNFNQCGNLMEKGGEAMTEKDYNLTLRSNTKTR